VYHMRRESETYQSPGTREEEQILVYDELLFTNMGGNLFITPKDYKDTAHSFESAFI
jgi:hypothetical protein